MSVPDEDRQKALEEVSPESVALPDRKDDIPVETLPVVEAPVKKHCRAERRETTWEQFRTQGGKAFTVYLYWDMFYSLGDTCTLCGGSGIIDTSDKSFGRKNYCICIEGQQLRVKEKGK